MKTKLLALLTTLSLGAGLATAVNATPWGDEQRFCAENPSECFCEERNGRTFCIIK